MNPRVQGTVRSGSGWLWEAAGLPEAVRPWHSTLIPCGTLSMASLPVACSPFVVPSETSCS